MVRFVVVDDFVFKCWTAEGQYYNRCGDLIWGLAVTLHSPGRTNDDRFAVFSFTD